MTARLHQRVSSPSHLLDTLVETARANRPIEAWALKGADIDQRDESGCTPLYWSILHDNPSNTEMLLRLGASSEVAPILHALFHAVTFDSKGVFDLLLKYFFWNEASEGGLGIEEYLHRLHRDELMQIFYEHSQRVA